VTLAVTCALTTLAFGSGAVAGATPTTASSTTASSAPSTTTTTTVAGQSSISAAEAQVSALEAQISQQQAVLDQADEQYNQAQVNLATTQTSLKSTATSIEAAKAQLSTERAHLREDAIEAYMSDTAGSSMASLFASPSDSTQTRDYYQQLGSSTVAADVARVAAGQKQLTDTQTKLLGEQQAETAQLAQVNTARQGAQTVADQSEATLASVKGSVATQIAQQAAAQAKAAAQTAATATTPASAQAAAAQASQAAQVATSLKGGSATAVNATTAANQAATAAAVSSPSSPAAGAVTVSASGNAQAAGLAAVHGAIKYMGVPYLWAGASSAGLDCSGLTMLAWAQAGVSMDHSAADQYARFPHVALNALQPGDLIFYNLDGDGIDHVVMYVGPYLDGQATPYGQGTIIQAAHTGTFVTYDPIWYQGIVGAARP
jgi:cell wall-associated NlpC family hydrolase